MEVTELPGTQDSCLRPHLLSAAPNSRGKGRDCHTLSSQTVLGAQCLQLLTDFQERVKSCWVGSVSGRSVVYPMNAYHISGGAFP